MKAIFAIKNIISSLISSKPHKAEAMVQRTESTPLHLQTNVSGEVYLDIYNRPVHDAEAQFYPPKVNGLSVFCVDAILKRYKEHIINLEQHVDIGSHRTTDAGINLFEARYLSVIRNFAEYVHMLPASEYHHHSQPGGLFRHSLDAALIALRKADNQLPPTVGKVDLDAQRRVRYLYASWVGALLHDTGKILTDMQVSAYTVYDEENNLSVPIANWKKPIKPWIPQIETLISWATRNNVERYFVHFKSSRVHKEHVSSGATLLPHILKGEGLEFIMDSPDDLYSNLTSALNGYAQINGYLATAIRFGDSVSTSKDVKTMATAAFGTLKKSRMLSIVDTMRSLKKEWNFNNEKGHAYVIGDCVFIRWQAAFNSILKSARENKFDALPNDTTSLLGMMEDFRIVEPFDNDNRFALFLMGKFSEQDVLNIIDEKVSVKWIELIKVVYREWVYDSDPIHPNLEGLLYLSKTNKYFITKEDGSFTELSFDTSALNDEKETVIDSTNELHDKVKIKSTKKVTTGEKATAQALPTDTLKCSSVKDQSTNKSKAATTSSKAKDKHKFHKPQKPKKAEIPHIKFENSCEAQLGNDKNETPIDKNQKSDTESNQATQAQIKLENSCDGQLDNDKSETPIDKNQKSEIKSKQATQAQTESLVDKSAAAVTNDYFLSINNKWYIDVNKYVAAHNTDTMKAGNQLLERGLIRQKLGSSSLATLVRRKSDSSVVCFELTPLGKTTLTNEVCKAPTKTAASNSSNKHFMDKKSESVKEEKADTSKPINSLSDSTESEYSTPSLKGTLGEILLENKSIVKGDREYINIKLKDLANATDSKQSNINGYRISKVIQILKTNFSYGVEITDMSTFTIRAHMQDVSTKEVFK